MKNYCLLSFGLILFFLTSCSDQPKDLLSSAKHKIIRYNSIYYKQQSLYPNPVGKIDTIETLTTFRANGKSPIGYDFIFRTANVDKININGVLRNANHAAQNIELFTNFESEKVKSYLNNLRTVMYSPITFLKKNDWQFVSDTIINRSKFSDFFRIENDTVIDGNTLYTEQHIFINQKTELIERWERRNFYNGNLSQTVVFNYSDYNIENTSTQLAYDIPLNYSSVLYGKNDDRLLLKVGQKAPLFIAKDISGKSFKLEDHIGKKILLNFSSINCGYCHQALKFIRENEIMSSNELLPVYLPVWDKEEDVKEYFTKVNSEFNVLLNSDKIAGTFGVSSTPTFFLIDENGTIEQVVIGNDKNFLMSLKK